MSEETKTSIQTAVVPGLDWSGSDDLNDMNDLDMMSKDHRRSEAHSWKEERGYWKASECSTKTDCRETECLSGEC
jgi:hypothetical protein